MGKKSKYLIIIGFILCLTLPLLKFDILGGKISNTENRYLAGFPKIFNDNKKLNRGIKKSTENWLNDNIGYRKNFIEIVSNITFKGLKRSPTSKVEIGEDGWMFYTLDDNMKIPEGKFEINEALLKNIKNTMESLNNFLKEKNIEFVLILPPSKTSIYPEKIKGEFYSVRETPVDIVSNYLKDSTKINVINLKQALLNAKNDQIYFKTDTHWNYYGAYIGYKEIIKEMNQFRMIDSKPFKPSFSEQYRLGEFPIMMGNSNLIAPEKYNETIIPDTIKNIYNENDRNHLDIILKKINFASPGIFHFKNDTRQKNILIYGDSFFASWNMMQLFANNFNEVEFVWIYQNNWNNELNRETIDYFKPDIVILEIAERYIRNLGNHLNERNLYGNLKNPNSKILNIEFLNVIERNKKYTFKITVQNTSSDKWSEKQGIRLCIFQDGKDWGYRIKIPKNIEILPGDSYEFVLNNFGAPPNDKTFLEFQMVEEGINWFGEKKRVDIKIE